MRDQRMNVERNKKKGNNEVWGNPQTVANDRDGKKKKQITTKGQVSRLVGEGKKKEIWIKERGKKQKAQSEIEGRPGWVMVSIPVRRNRYVLTDWLIPPAPSNPPQLPQPTNPNRVMWFSMFSHRHHRCCNNGDGGRHNLQISSSYLSRPQKPRKLRVNKTIKLRGPRPNPKTETGIQKTKTKKHYISAMKLRMKWGSIKR